MRRALLSLSVILWLIAVRPAVAQDRSVDDPEAVHAGLRSVTVRHEEAKGPRSSLIEVARQHLCYDSAGHLIEDVQLGPEGKLVVRMLYTWDRSGRLAETRYSDHTGRVEVRQMSYKLDPGGRILVRDLRNPAAPPGELVREQFSWEADGSHTVRTYRHYAKEGPYADGSASYDATGRLQSRCVGSHCELYEYDAHGEISRIRQQQGEDHFYRVYETEYDRTGHIARRRIGGTETWYRRNARGEVVEERKSSTGSPAVRLVYEYDYRLPTPAP